MKIAALWHRMLLAVLLGGASLAAGADEPRWNSPARLVDSFVEVALKSAYSTRQNPVRKWIVPPRYFIVHGVGDEELHRRLIGVHFQHLAGITGLAIQPAASVAVANFLIVLTSEDRLEEDMPRYFGSGSAHQRAALYRDSQCLASIAVERKKGSIVRAVVMIPVDRARGNGDLVSCVVEELTHAMGLPNDSPKVFPSIFSRKSTQAFLTGLDSLLLSMLYDPRVKPGMDENTVRPILQTIAAEYQRDKRFDSAERIAAESGLAGLDR